MRTTTAAARASTASKITNHLAAEDDPALLTQIAQSFTQASAYAYMVFNLLCCKSTPLAAGMWY